MYKNIFKKMVNHKIYFVIFIICFGIITFTFFTNFNFNNNHTNSIVKCNMKFGLCPAAKCVPDPNNESKAFCLCDVQNGTNYSFGNNSCKNITPYTTKSGEEIIFSDFSPIIKKKGFHLVTCPPEEVNLNCMNKICSVNPNDPSKAICVCDKTNNKGLSWVTFNKNDEPKNCSYQSGAALQQHLITSEFIKQNP